MSSTTPVQTPKRSENHVVALYDHFCRFASKWQSPLLLGIRVYIGYQCVISGLAHLHHFDDTVQQFTEWKIPFPHLSVAISASTELIGGALLLVGFASRLISIPLIFNFLVAIIQTDLAFPQSRDRLLHIWNDQTILFQDTAFPFLVTTILILVFGPGFLSVDGILKFMRRKK